MTIITEWHLAEEGPWSDKEQWPLSRDGYVGRGRKDMCHTAPGPRRGLHVFKEAATWTLGSPYLGVWEHVRDTRGSVSFIVYRGRAYQWLRSGAC